MKLHIGITYDLRQEYRNLGFSEEDSAEFDAEETIDAIAAALESPGRRLTRIGGVKSLVGRLTAGETWDIVFNLAEGCGSLSREAQVPALLDAYGIPYTFSDATVLGLALNKGLTKRIVRDLGVPTAPFAVYARPEESAMPGLNFPLFAKPVAEGTSKGIDDRSIIADELQLRQIVTDLLRRFGQSVLVEEYLPGREFTVGVLGTADRARCLGVMEVLITAEEAEEVYSFANKMNYQRNVQYVRVAGDLAEECCRHALKVWQGLGCRDAGRVDFKLDRYGAVNFLEVNPLAGLNPLHSDLPILARLHGLSYQELITEVMDSALMRLARH